MIQSALLGGLFIGILSALPVIHIANCCCIWIAGGGVLAGYLLPQYDPPLTNARGAFVWLIAASALDVLIAPLQERVIQDVLANAGDMPPEARAWLEMMGNRGNAAFRLAAGFAFQVMAGFVFATLGGLLAAVFFAKAVPPPPTPGDAVPPPLPPQP
ncbi:MAG: hypothetical protein FJW14_01825 [Acidimicrobiia bacterium]|nr:hypothetical protein [Acidimicrobiia bacterium]